MSDLSKWKVLLVDDEADTQQVMVPLLEHYGISATCAYTAEEALEILRHQPTTVAIIDLALPRMNGWEMLKTMRENPATANIPAVAMTAYHSTTVAQEAITAGFAAFFPKPINARTFVEDLERAIA